MPKIMHMRAEGKKQINDQLSLNDKHNKDKRHPIPSAKDLNVSISFHARQAT
jgi:hypothetical protein